MSKKRLAVGWQRKYLKNKFTSSPDDVNGTKWLPLNGSSCTLYDEFATQNSLETKDDTDDATRMSCYKVAGSAVGSVHVLIHTFTHPHP